VRKNELYPVVCPACKKSFRLCLEELRPRVEYCCPHCATLVVLTSKDIPKAARVRKAKILADISKGLNR